MKLYEIEIAIAKHFNPRVNLIVPNVYWGMGLHHECDLLVLRKSGYCAEVEIKRSKADVKADLKKWHNHSSDMIRELFFALPMNLYECCREFIPERAGILCVEKQEWGYQTTVMRGPKPNKFARRLNDKERYNLARLGCMRIWGLKRKLI